MGGLLYRWRKLCLRCFTGGFGWAKIINRGVTAGLTTKFTSRVRGVARGRQMGGELVELAASLGRDAQKNSALHHRSRTRLPPRLSSPGSDWRARRRSRSFSRSVCSSRTSAIDRRYRSSGLRRRSRTCSRHTKAPTAKAMTRINASPVQTTASRVMAAQAALWPCMNGKTCRQEVAAQILRAAELAAGSLTIHRGLSHGSAAGIPLLRA